MKNLYIKNIIIILCTFFFVACTGVPLPQINYRSTFSSEKKIDEIKALDFAKHLELLTHFQIINIALREEDARYERSNVIELVPKSGERMVISIMVDKQSNTIFITIVGDEKSEPVASISKTIERLFVEMYPNLYLEKYKRYGVLFGP